MDPLMPIWWWVWTLFIWVLFLWLWRTDEDTWRRRRLLYPMMVIYGVGTVAALVKTTLIVARYW